MPAPIEFDTARLRLRLWRDGDLEPFAALNADPRVMEFFPAPIDARGWGLWAAERLDTGRFVGFVGLQVPAAHLPCSPCVEVGWRLEHAAWGQGFATEAARGALAVAFERLRIPEIVSFTALGNRRSRAVMERLGMRDTGTTFAHPGVPAGSPLREHCLYRLADADWRRTAA